MSSKYKRHLQVVLRVKILVLLDKHEARGFFEASFPVVVLDKNGQVLANGIAQAQGDWMTENLVAFKADIKIPITYMGPATLILKNDNPSGIPSRDASVSIPITIEY